MTILLRHRCATSKILAVISLLTLGGLRSAEGQSLQPAGSQPVFVEDTQPFNDPQVQAVCASDCSIGCAEGCADAYCGQDCYGCDPCQSGGTAVFVFGEFLYLTATDGDIAHAQQQNGIGGAGTVPFGRIGTVEMDYEPAYRIGGGIGLDACSALIVSYTRYDATGTDELFAPNIPGGGGAVGSLVHHPGAALTASPGPLTANYDLDYQLADVVFRDVWRGSNCYVINYSIGGQFANMSQEFLQTGLFGGSTGGAINTATDIDFNGGGIKVGLDGERRIGCRISVYGKIYASAISGRFSSDYVMQNVTTETRLAEVQWKDNRVISLVEYELGMAYTSCNQHLRLSAGYLFQHWGNMVTTSNFIDGVQADNYTDLSDGLGFNGVSTRLELCF